VLFGRYVRHKKSSASTAKTMYAHLGKDRLLVFLDLDSIIPRRDATPSSLLSNAAPRSGCSDPAEQLFVQKLYPHCPPCCERVRGPPCRFAILLWEYRRATHSEASLPSR